MKQNQDFVTGFRKRWSDLSAGVDDSVRIFRDRELPWLTPTTVDEFVRDASPWLTIPNQPAVPAPIDYQELARIAHIFHTRAATLTDAVQQELAALASGSPTIRVAHQPNFLPSLNVVAQTALSDLFAKRLSTPAVQLFVLIDYDVSTDRRYRHALFPSISSRQGWHPLSTPAVHHHAEQLIFADPRASLDVVKTMVSNICMFANQDLAVLRNIDRTRAVNRHSIDQGEKLLASYLLDAFERSETQAEANAIFLSKIANELLGLPTVFVPGHQVLPLMTPHFEFLWSRSTDIVEHTRLTALALKNVGLRVSRSLAGDSDASSSVALFWRVCENCICRLPLVWNGFGKAEAKCPRCGSEYTVGKEDIQSLVSNPNGPLLLPRVLLDDLLDGFAWRHVMGCSYRGGFEHYVFSAMTARRFGIRPLPEFLSQRSDAAGLDGLVPVDYERALAGSSDYKRAFELISSGKASIAHSIVWQRDLSPSILARDFLAR